MKICHEVTAAHLGATKTKDTLFKTFYWPNCYKDVDNFVKTCDVCQRAGKSQDKKKAPLKLVPVIPEIFSKINVDACGPLPQTPSGNRYLITALCMSSKYPDAIPVENLRSKTIVDVLLQIFSRMGFPKVLQTDQGTSFMSALTTEFLRGFGIKVVRSSVYHPQAILWKGCIELLREFFVYCVSSRVPIGRKYCLKLFSLCELQLTEARVFLQLNWFMGET
ncbi:hypothetical protein JTE90_020200 [Oedothorax gibbosus]|uniref:RNA-directed DNA polymerase n=1 Tax=Oedothorax gibbosus TaxID=931172 RepID=A0AAV6TTL3_9ARAC|nr:hypothetical protein JTE90_020200 [Oedothorax gibbosus]